MAERTRHSGMLMKQGSRVKNWKLRWFELTTDDVLKYYHHDAKGVQLKGAVDLADCTCILAHDNLAGVRWPQNYGPARSGRNCFGIALGRRTLCVVAPRPEEAEAWIEILRRRSPQISQFNFQADVLEPIRQDQQSTRAWGLGTDPGFAVSEAAADKVAKPKRKGNDEYRKMKQMLMNNDDLVLGKEEETEKAAREEAQRLAHVQDEPAPE